MSIVHVRTSCLSHSLLSLQDKQSLGNAASKHNLDEVVS
jgi:hypothetical protein